jgi:type I restriction enzyme, S subunit
LNIIATSEITPAIRKWKPYTSYKHSGVEWLGMVPEHWNVSTLKLLAPTINRGKSPDYVEEGGIPVINQACIYWEGLRLENVKFDIGKEGGNGRGRLFSGDVLINSTGTGTLGRACVFRQRGTYLADGHVTIVRLDQTAELPEYLFYLFQTPIYQGFVYAALVSGSTNQIELSRESFRATPTIVPPINEQARIVHFLDRETAKIDVLVAKKERLIALLQEKRAALITRAVTKGLDPNAPMKDSGIEWLGEIPAHWEVKRVKWAAKMESGHTPDKKVEAYWADGDVPWVSLNDSGYLRDHDYIADTAYYTNALGLANSSARLLPTRSVVFSRDATVGLSAITTRPMAVSQHFIAWLCGLDLLPEYLLYVFRAMTQELERLTMGATIKTIGMPDVRTLTTPLPPRQEQEAIVSYIREETKKMDTLVAKICQGIEKLKEYRTALISAAVTGKIDVREEISSRMGDSPERDAAISE